jgi:hypothetical protein
MAIRIGIRQTVFVNEHQKCWLKLTYYSVYSLRIILATECLCVLYLSFVFVILLKCLCDNFFYDWIGKFISNHNITCFLKRYNLSCMSRFSTLFDTHMWFEWRHTAYWVFRKKTFPCQTCDNSTDIESDIL